MEPTFGSPLFTIVPILVGIVFVIVIGTIVVRLGRGVAEWHRNNQMPVLRRDARVIAKREDVRSSGGHMHGVGRMHHHRSYTTYYVTFETLDEQRERIELQVSGHEYGMVAEGDVGALTHQGTRFKGFDVA